MPIMNQSLYMHKTINCHLWYFKNLESFADADERIKTHTYCSKMLITRLPVNRLSVDIFTFLVLLDYRIHNYSESRVAFNPGRVGVRDVTCAILPQQHTQQNLSYCVLIVEK